MKQKGFGWLWVIGVPLLIGLAALSPGEGNLLLAMAYPFTAAGQLLRRLSLMSAMGNRIAIVLYGAVCAAPLFLIRKGNARKENMLLFLAVAVLFRVMWLMVNPDMMPYTMRNDVGKAMYAGAFYSVMLTWGIMRLMLHADLSDQTRVYRSLRILLLVCATLFLMDGLGLGISRFRGAMEGLSSANTALSDSELMPSIMFLAADFTVSAAEGVLMAWLMFLGSRLVTALEEEPFGQSCVALCSNITLWCRRTIRAVAAANLLMNLAQVLLAGILVNVEVVLRLPVLSLAITFGLMALAKLLEQGKELKEDNDLFI